MDVEFLAGVMTILSFFSGGAGLPLGVPPEEDPFMQKVAPDECLAYVSWAGMKKPDPASENSTEALLAEPEVQRIIAEVDRRLTDALTAAGDEEDDSPAALLAKHGVSLGRPLLMRPTAIFIEKVEMGDRGPDIRGGALVNLGEDAAEVQKALEALQTTFAEFAKVEKVELAGTPAYKLTFGPDASAVFWALKGSYLIVGVGEGSFEGVLARVKTDPPKWLAEQVDRSEVRRVSSVIYVNLADSIESIVPMLGPDADEVRFGLRALGLDNAESLCVVSGLDRNGFVSNSHLKIQGEALGIMTFVSDKPLTPLDMEDIPADATLAIAARAEAENVYERFKKVVGEFEPGAPDQIDLEMRRVEEQTGLRIFDGIFPGLGDVWFAYNSPSEGGLIGTGLTAAVTVKDEKKLRPEFDKLMELMRDEFERMRGFRGGRGAVLKEMKFGDHVIHYIAGDDDLWVAPSFCMTKEHVIFALFPQNVKAFLSHGEGFESLATSPHVGPRMKMQGGPSAIVYQDTERLFKLLYPLVPMFAQMMAREFYVDSADFDLSLLPSVGALSKHLNPGLLTIARDRDGVTMESRQSLPGGIAGVAAPLMLGMYAPQIKQARLSARRNQSINNMRMIGIALHNYHDTHKRFPPAYTVDKEGKPLLSWRVLILPYLEHGALYEEFRLDEPWDSEHNRKLIALMPDIFRSPTSKAGEGNTVYLGVRGEFSVLSDTKRDGKIERVWMASVRDGTSNTAMTVEAADESAVEWTKPGDFKFDPDAPKTGLMGQHKTGFLAGFCDGSVQFLSKGIDNETLLLIFNRQDGKPVDWRRFVDAGRTYGSRTNAELAELGRAIGGIDQSYAVPADDIEFIEPDHRHDHAHEGEERSGEAIDDIGPRDDARRPETDVQGRVTLDGEPLAKAAVHFYFGDEKRPSAVGMTGDEGTYSMRTKTGNALRPGQYRVTIAKFSEPKANARTAEDALVRVLTLKRYASAETSGLQVEVVRGNNEVQFDLQGK